MFANLLLRLADWLKKRFGDKVATEESAENSRNANKYRKTDEINFTAIVANKLSNVTVSDSTIQVNGNQVAHIDESGQEITEIVENPRSEYLDTSLQRCVDKIKTIASRTYGIGGVILKPWIYNGSIYTDIIEQDRFYIIEHQGEVITSAGFIADTIIKDFSRYIRIEEHTLKDDGTYIILQKALKDEKEVALNAVPAWADIPPEVSITNVDQMLFAFTKCPTDNRERPDSLFGVPVTYGNEKLICEIVELLNMFHGEFKKKESFIGASELLFKKGVDGKERLPQTGVFKLLNVLGKVDDRPFWEVFSPDIRTQAFIDGIIFKLGLLEKAIGVNQGVLTDLVTEAATATAIKRSSGDTFSLVDTMRQNLEAALKQLVYAYDVYSNAFGLAPMGEYELSFDWDYSLLEDTSERWTQLKDGHAMGVVRPEETRMFLFDEDEATALANLPEGDDLIGNLPDDDSGDPFGEDIDIDNDGDADIDALLKELGDLAGGF